MVAVKKLSRESEKNVAGLYDVAIARHVGLGIEHLDVRMIAEAEGAMCVFDGRVNGNVESASHGEAMGLGIAADAVTVVQIDVAALLALVLIGDIAEEFEEDSELRARAAMSRGGDADWIRHGPTA